MTNDPSARPFRRRTALVGAIVLVAVALVEVERGRAAGTTAGSAAAVGAFSSRAAAAAASHAAIPNETPPAASRARAGERIAAVDASATRRGWWIEGALPAGWDAAGVGLRVARADVDASDRMEID